MALPVVNRSRESHIRVKEDAGGRGTNFLVEVAAVVDLKLSLGHR